MTEPYEVPQVAVEAFCSGEDGCDTVPHDPEVDCCVRAGLANARPHLPPTDEQRVALLRDAGLTDHWAVRHPDGSVCGNPHGCPTHDYRAAEAIARRVATEEGGTLLHRFVQWPWQPADALSVSVPVPDVQPDQDEDFIPLTVDRVSRADVESVRRIADMPSVLDVRVDLDGVGNLDPDERLLYDLYRHLDCPAPVDPLDPDDCANVAAESIRVLRAAGRLRPLPDRPWTGFVAFTGHASPGCGCGITEAGRTYIDPICWQKWIRDRDAGPDGAESPVVDPGVQPDQYKITDAVVEAYGKGMARGRETAARDIDAYADQNYHPASDDRRHYRVARDVALGRIAVPGTPDTPGSLNARLDALRAAVEPSGIQPHPSDTRDQPAAGTAGGTSAAGDVRPCYRCLQTRPLTRWDVCAPCAEAEGWSP